MDKIVAYAGQIGLQIILDHHRSDAGDGRRTAAACGTSGAYPEQVWIDNWTMLASRYANNPTVIGADLHNEPHGPATWGGGGANDWRLAAERAGNAVLAVEPELADRRRGCREPYQSNYYWWGGNLMGVKDRPIQLARRQQARLLRRTTTRTRSTPSRGSATRRSPTTCRPCGTRSGATSTSRTSRPCTLGEFGTKLEDPKDLAWLDKIRSYLNGDFDANGSIDIPAGQQGINWTWWSWNPNSGDTGGILADDWTSVRQDKLDQLSSLLSRVFTGSAGDDVLNGSAYADSLAGLQGSDRLSGKDGDDDLDGGPGADYMVGGAGNDTYHVDHPNDQVIEGYGGGNDTVLTQVSYALGSFVETLASADSLSAAGLSLTGNDEPNTLIGDAGTNTLDGRGGADTLLGLAGNDTYLVDNALDVVIETAGGGYDMVRTSVSYALSPSSEVEYLAALSESLSTLLDLTGSDIGNLIIGNAGQNSLSGLGGSDRIYAGAGNDRLDGGSGDDVLFGQWGRDTLVGGPGRDVFVFDAKPQAANLDRILDFVVRDDSIYLDNAVFKALGKKGSLCPAVQAEEGRILCRERRPRRIGPHPL